MSLRAAAYREDLAHIHHHGFGGFAREAAPGLLALLRRAGIQGGLVVDLGCGSGIWLRELGRAGFRTAGVDASPALVRMARRLAPAADLRVGSVYDVDLPACDAVTAIGEVLGYRVRGRQPPLARFFKKVARVLRPGGLLVFDLLVRARGRPMAYRTWSAGDSWAVLVEASEDSRRHRLAREITTFRRADGAYRRDRERHEVEVFARADVLRWLRSAGFSVRVSRRYGALDLAPRRLAFQARRR
jgi:SAM-dependent methyltransferase